MRLTLTSLSILLVLVAPLSAADRVSVTFAYVQEQAQALASAPFQAPDSDAVPKKLRELTYDQYHQIAFQPDHALWQGDRLSFTVQFFPLGYLFQAPVQFHECTDTHTQPIPFVPDFFAYGKSDSVRVSDDSLGYAGFSLHYPINRKGVYDEVVSHLGRSYFRAVGKHQNFGISARGLGVDTGEPAEEFPYFKEFWIHKPDDGDYQCVYYGLLDGPSVTGAYEFTVEPNVTTKMKVRAALFFRKQPAVTAVAPLTSMFWFGENTLDRPRDFRPEVHDSDGLLLHAGTGEWLWRPLVNDRQARVSVFEGTDVRGFGLLQRDRSFSNYEDLEALYQSRPSLWVEPDGKWGPGSVKLMEWATSDEFHDNVVAFWQPAEPPALGEAYHIGYTLHWTGATTFPGEQGYVKATRLSGVGGDRHTHRFVVDFAGEKIEGLGEEEPMELDVSARPDCQIRHARVQKNPFDKSWRATFEITAPPDARVDLRASLKLRDDTLTETWSYLWQP